MADTPQKLIRAIYRDRLALAAALLPDARHGGLFVTTRSPPELMTPVMVEVQVPELEAGLMIQGVIAARRVDRGPSALRPGVGVHFLPSEATKRSFVEGVASGQVVDLARRRHTRIPVRVQVQWSATTSRARYTSLVEDISEGGAFIRTRRFQRPGSRVVLELSSLGREAATVIDAMVTRSCHTPGEEGIGVQFIRRGLTELEVRELVGLLVHRTYGEAIVGG